MENRITKKVIDKAREFMGIHRTGVRLLKIAAKIDSSAMPLGMIQAVFQAVNTYLGLFLMARLIDSLLAGDFSRAFFPGVFLRRNDGFYGLAVWYGGDSVFRTSKAVCGQVSNRILYHASKKSVVSGL